MSMLPPLAPLAVPGLDCRRIWCQGGVGGLLLLAACVPSSRSRDPEPAGIRAFAPAHGTVYTRIDLAGSGFQGASKVTFGRVEATRFVVPADDVLYAAVPPGAGTGPIEVTTPRGVIASRAAFQVDPGPPPLYLTGMIPASGPVGTRVTLRGAGLFSVTSVAFGGVQAAMPAPLGDSEMAVTVPPGALTGPVTVQLPDGTRAETVEVFKVDGLPPEAPVIKGYHPKEGPAGTPLELDGAHFATVHGAAIGGSEATFHTWSDTRMTVWVPVKAPPSGSLRVDSASGSGTSPAPFTLVQPKPVIHALFPRAGLPGTEVTILGDHLRETTAVRFGKVRGTGLVVKADTEVRVVVPEGAVTGPLVVEVPHGHGASGKTFTVTDTDPGLQVGILGLYVTQATQRMDGSVPLVAGREGLLRAFLVGDRPNEVRPVLRVTLKDAHGQTLLSKDVTAARRRLPLRLDETDLGGSWNLPIPGELLRPGLRVRAKVLPAPDLPVPPEGLAFPPEGKSMALNIVKVPPLGLTLVPIVSGLGRGDVVSEGRSLASWVAFFKHAFPVGDLDVDLAPPFTTTLALGSGTGAETLLKLRLALEALRLRSDGGNRRYWYGVFKAPYVSGIAGLGDRPKDPESNLNRTAVGWDHTGLRQGSNYPEVMAHELGHLLNRRHAPCGSAAGPDYHYPYRGGTIGAAGLDLQDQQTLDPWLYTDVMGYCSPLWVSDFTYKGVLEWRLKQGSHTASGSLASRQSGKGLLIWGTAGPGGAVTLEPAFETRGHSALPPPGDYHLECLDEAGQVLYSLAFEPTTLPDGAEAEAEGEGALAGFAFAIPLTPALEARLASIQVRKGGVVVGRLGSAPGAGGQAAARLVREPVATVWGEGEVLVTWDPAAYPRIIVKDPVTSQDLAMADGGNVTLPTAAHELEVILSDGLRTYTERIQVRP